MVDKFSISAKEEGTPLFQVLKNRIEGLSGKEAKRRIESKECLVNSSAPLFSTYKVKKGDRIAFKQKLETRKPLSILFENEDFLVIDKPSGLCSEEIKMGKLVHRLDKETSGTMLLAKNEATQKQLENAFRRRTVFKTYLALVAGCPKQESGVIQNKLAPLHRYDGGVIMGKSSEGGAAKTSWKCLKRFDGYSLLACFPYTGKTHQIRVHLSSIGHPILGDAKYGKKRLDLRLLLHSYEIRFSLKKKFAFKTEIPSAILNLV